MRHTELDLDYKNMAVFCPYCSFHCRVRLDLIKHVFSSHSMEPTFRFVCGIKGCLHSFKFGATLSSFKSHSNRKHPSWQKYVNDPAEEPSTVRALGTPAVSASSEIPYSDDNVTLELPEHNDSDGCFDVTVDSTEETSILTVHKPSALFLLSCKERFKLPQTAVNFAVGSVNAVVNNVCDLAQRSVAGAEDAGDAIP